MGLKEELKTVVKFVEAHGADKVLDALEKSADLGLDELAKELPDKYSLLAKAAEALLQTRLHTAVTKLKTKLEAQGGDQAEESS